MLVRGSDPANELPHDSQTLQQPVCPGCQGCCSLRRCKPVSVGQPLPPGQTLVHGRGATPRIAEDDQQNPLPADGPTEEDLEALLMTGEKGQEVLPHWLWEVRVGRVGFGGVVGGAHGEWNS